MRHLSRLLALAAALALVTQAPAGAQAGASRSLNATCSPPTLCDHALGIALTPPPGWIRLMPPKVPPHVIALVTRPTSGPDYPIRLHIAAWGTTRDQNEMRAANAGAGRLINGFRIGLHVSRVAVRYGGTPGVLIRGLPPTPGPTVDVVLAHAGAVYLIVAPGSALAPDQQAALASLRFVPRRGPFPSANPPAPHGSPATRIIPTRLRVTPGRVSLGQRFAVTLIGVHAGETYTFQAAPVSRAGFGGGLMGTYRAGPAGTIHFVYPAFRQGWEVGTWRITASHGGVQVASALVRVMRSANAVTIQRLHLAHRVFGLPAVYGNSVAWGVRTGTSRNGIAVKLA